MAEDADMEGADDETQLPKPSSGAATAKGAGAGIIKYGEAEAAAGLQSGMAAGNIHVQGSDAATLELEKASLEAAEKQEALLAAVEARRALKQTVVPTSDADIRRALRTIEEPVTLFGEGVMERSQRLRKLLAGMDEDDPRKLRLTEERQSIVFDEVQAPPTKREHFLTEGPPELRAARMRIATFSLQAARARIAGAKRKRDSPDEDEAAEREQTLDSLRTVVAQSSERADDRPLTDCAFSPDGQLLATAAWSGLLKLWGLPGCDKRLTIRAHEEASRITGIAWHPHAGAHSQETGDLALASGGSDSTARLFSGQGTLLRTLTSDCTHAAGVADHKYAQLQTVSSLKGHTARLGRVAFHPMGRHLGTASYDETWRLWDVEAGQCLAEQEGHSRSLYAIAFHRDGSLAASGGLDAIGRLWDMRTGKSVQVLEGHVQGILSLDFSANGHHLASGGEDHSCRIWDLRKRRCLYTIPAHSSLVSQVRYDPEGGQYLVTAGFDAACKVWSGSDFRHVRTLAGHEGKVQGLDICPPSMANQTVLIASACHDKTIKLWAPDPAPSERPDAVMQE